MVLTQEEQLEIETREKCQEKIQDKKPTKKLEIDDFLIFFLFVTGLTKCEVKFDHRI